VPSSAKGLKARVCVLTVRTVAVHKVRHSSVFRVLRGSAVTHQRRRCAVQAVVSLNSNKAPNMLMIAGDMDTTRCCAAAACISHFSVREEAASLARGQHPLRRQRAKRPRR
jgi:hypothetical protein